MGYGSGKLLIVDDEPEFGQSLVKRLQLRGYTVGLAAGGLEAIACLTADTDIDIVILDVVMPGMNGIETLAAVKDVQSIVEVIMLTGRSSVGSAVEAMKKGAFDYLEKPCDLDQLIDKVEAALVRKRNREHKLLELKMKPYITDRERCEKMINILKS